MMNEKIAKLLENEEVVRKLDAAQNEEAFCSVLVENGATADDINALIAHMHNMDLDGELSEDALETVAGGAPILQTVLAKWIYRFKHKKVFVKATARDGVITVTARFGNGVTETYYY